MKTYLPKLPILLKPFLLSLFISLAVLAVLSLQTPRRTQKPTTTTTHPDDLRIRTGYSSYDAYIQRQLNKTLNPKLRKIWTTRDWARKVRVFARFFEDLKQRGLLSNGSKSLCIGARVGQEVAALKQIGVSDSVGMDLVPYSPLVIKGKFVGEIERTLRPGGVCVLHVLISKRADKYSANDLFSVGPLVKLFERSEMVEVRSVDGFGLDTEVVFRKKDPRL
ncbi:S-adenosyl-L-methionine-dependent methyltransferases superfamily protein [Actinidia rufa]|uniref:S-adenosyl-L-methionine-dependent methyltransferases superfamily protein n=1 Tax=Actinidia rufa TaxID=165716 RepID=A0A7J0FZ52_9ERIC|nr:S-adenosyl-L-methionine-dependent methyltransferases superfamily protein [Actinidia rufa]